MKIHHHTALGVALSLPLLACGAGTGEQPGTSPLENVASAGSRPSMGSLTTRAGGEEMVWQILAGVPGDELRRPSAVIASHGPMTLLSLQGTAPDDRSRQANFSATLMQQGDSYTVASQELLMLPEGASGPQLQGLEMEVEWERLELDAKGGHVEGRFSGFLCPFGASTGLDEGCQPLEGQFDSEVRSDAVLQGVLDNAGGSQP